MGVEKWKAGKIEFRILSKDRDDVFSFGNIIFNQFDSVSSLFNVSS